MNTYYDWSEQESLFRLGKGPDGTVVEVVADLDQLAIPYHRIAEMLRKIIVKLPIRISVKLDNFPKLNFSKNSF